MTVGVLALQGAFKEHLDFLNELGVKTLKVRTLEELNEVDGLILPGGESTVMGKLLKRYELEEGYSLDLEQINNYSFHGTLG